MPKSRPPYPVEFKQEAVRLVRAGQTPEDLSDRLGCSAQAIRNWVKQADVDAGKAEGLTSAERDELKQLRKENKQLRQDREILKKAAAFFARDTDGSSR
jgi:transposase